MSMRKWTPRCKRGSREWIMERWICLILLLCLLGGCAQPQTPAQVQPDAAAESAQEPDTVAVPMEIIETMEMEVRYDPDWRGSEPQQGEPVTPQPGDTARTWDPDRAGEYPADEDCTPMELLEKWLAVEGLSWSDLDDRGCDQLVLAAATAKNGAKTRTICFSRQADGTWAAEPELTDMTGYVGARGIAHDRRRSSEQSPAGLWPLGSAFGLAEEPEGLKVPWRQITDRSDWVCDSKSVYFNTWQERGDPDLTGSWRWSTSEHLADYDETYTYACIIEYNTPPYVVPKRGCAIFLHVSDHPTEGCVGLLTDDMVRTLQWLNPHRNPHILITGYET